MIVACHIFLVSEDLTTNPIQRNIALEDESCTEDFEFVEKEESEELKKYKDFLEDAVMVEKADLADMPTPMRISDENLKAEEKEMNLLDSDPSMRSSFMAIDEALEKFTDESSEELSKILRRLLLPSIIACIWMPIIKLILLKLFRIARSRLFKLVFSAFNYFQKLHQTISNFFNGDFEHDYTFVYHADCKNLASTESTCKKEVMEELEEKREIMIIVRLIVHPSMIRYIWSPLVCNISSKMFKKLKYDIENYIKGKKRG
jgi:hypothetical protein